MTETKENKKFQLETKPQIYLLIGQQNSGKSHMLKQIFYCLRNHFKFGVAYSGSTFNNELQAWIDPKLLHDFAEEKLTKYVTSLQQWMTANPGRKHEPNYIIFDDLIGMVNFYSPWMANWLGIYRHTNTTVFFLSQYLAAAATPPFFRNSCNIVMAFRVKQKSTIKIFFETWGQDFDKYNTFKSLFLKITEQKYCAMLYKSDDSTDVNDLFFKVMASEHIPKFMMKNVVKIKKQPENMFQMIPQTISSNDTQKRWALEGDHPSIKRV